jgi:hypothetical protein
MLITVNMRTLTAWGQRGFADKLAGTGLHFETVTVIAVAPCLGRTEVYPLCNMAPHGRSC